MYLRHNLSQSISSETAFGFVVLNNSKKRIGEWQQTQKQNKEYIEQAEKNAF